MLKWLDFCKIFLPFIIYVDIADTQQPTEARPSASFDDSDDSGKCLQFLPLTWRMIWIDTVKHNINICFVTDNSKIIWQNLTSPVLTLGKC